MTARNRKAVPSPTPTPSPAAGPRPRGFAARLERFGATVQSIIEEEMRERGLWGADDPPRRRRPTDSTGMRGRRTA